MTPRLFFALAIFLGTYLPLSMILLMQDLDNKKLKGNICFNFLTSGTCHLPLQKPFLSVSLFLVCLACFIFSWFALNLAKPDGQKIKIIESKYTPSDLMNYVLPYIVSFMSISYMETNKFLGFVIFLLYSCCGSFGFHINQVK